MKTIILIPPSEGKTEGGTGKALTKVNPITQELLGSISKDENPEKLYGVKGKALEKAIATNKEILTSKTLPAIERYSGVVYKGLDYPSLKRKKIADERLYMISALFGLVNSQDHLPDYKLKIDKLGADKMWLPIITKDLSNYFVIDLLPHAHRKAVSYTNGVAVDFVIIKGGKKIPAGHNGKFIKGRFVRFLIENDITNPKDFSKFKEDGFSWDGSCFIKKV